MREVSAKLFGFMRETCRRAGADVEAAQAGLALSDVDVDAFGERVDWDELALFLERAHGRWTLDEIEKLGERYAQGNRLQHVLARVLPSPRLFYRAGFILAKPAFPHLDFVIEPQEDRLHLEVRLPEGFEPSHVYFHATVGQLRLLNPLLGRPPARVEADTGPRHGVYDVYFDEPPTRLDRTVGAAEDAYSAAAREVIWLYERALSADSRPEAPSENRVLELQRRLDLTRMEARVAARLALGMSVKEIARALRIRISTVRSHLRVAYAKTGTRGQSDLVRLVLTGAGSTANGRSQ